MMVAPVMVVFADPRDMSGLPTASYSGLKRQPERPAD
jgi:hypothetical protein